MPYDVFISYSRPDQPWAAKLDASLQRAGLEVFFDRARLEAGRQWEDQLKRAIRETRHLVVLWSSNAKQSDWVTREVSNFDARIGDDAASMAQHRLIFLNLERVSSAYSSLQAINDLVDSYKAGADAVDTNLWNQVVRKIISAIRGDLASVPIPVAVLTLTAEELRGFGASERENLNRELGVSPEALAARYGESRDDWRPLGNDITITTLLDQHKDEINRLVPGKTFRWEREPASFWTDVSVVRGYSLSFMAAPLSLLVIDPVALASRHVYQRLMHFPDCFESSKTAILVIPPFRVDPSYGKLRSWLLTHASPYFDPYFDPMIPPKKRLSAHCAFGTGDTDEMKRLLFVTVGQFVSDVSRHDKPEYLQV
ncbi:toll/interleukin-1 receptor domain-containing protein [Sorangium sp. KYC3313]|uniref:toll/interleukin-1 receptor domain-containing protein n=1 Tax=Sorangium sp. KYC3313 TaxID=3449740 RepID=UPI003F8CAF9C